MILTGDRLKPSKEKLVGKTKLTPISANEPVKVSDKGKRNRVKNITATLDDIFGNDDDDDIQGDASGITVPISKSLGNNQRKQMANCTHEKQFDSQLRSEINYWFCCHWPLLLLLRFLPTANFKDSKEIMMTSDSEAEYKYSSSNYVQVEAAYVSQCPEGELRCINGHCITISQLCDKVK